MARTPSRFADSAGSGATIRDVAAGAGVSVATVSRVFNSPEVVREETVGRVREIAQKLNYVPHLGARSLSTRRTNTIGVLLPDLHGEFFSEVIRGIDSAARGSGYHLLVSGSHSDWDEMAAMLSATRGRVDGLIVMSPDANGKALHASLPNAVPAVLLNCPGVAGPSITIDNRGGATQVMRHLGELGHRRIAFIKGPETNADAQERLRGYRLGLARLAGGSEAIELPGDFTEAGGYAATEMALQLEPAPTAIFAANDAMAVGAIFALREAGVNVPRQMAVVGFDDIPIASYITPRLTTVSVDIARLGQRALELLLTLLGDGTSSPRNETIPTTLVVRDSCGAPGRTAQRRRAPPDRTAKKGRTPGVR
ncbi:MAG: LacI family DNA-binding transcriptional regulator [Thermoanaerobaculia bacterium]